MSYPRYFNCIDWEQNTPPGISPAFGAWYYTGSAPTGVWAGHANQLALFDFGGAYTFEPFQLGDTLFSQPHAANYYYDGTEVVRATRAGVFCSKLTSNVTVPTAYADVGGWDAADPIDSSAFSWNTTTGILTVNRKLRAVAIEVVARFEFSSGAAANAATIKVLRDPNTAVYADLAGTEVGSGVNSGSAININTCTLKKIVSLGIGHKLKLQHDQNTGTGVMILAAAGTTFTVTELI